MTLNSPMSMKNSNCAVQTDPFYLFSGLISICFVTTSNALKYCFNVVYLFSIFLVITLRTLYICIIICKTNLVDLDNYPLRISLNNCCIFIQLFLLIGFLGLYRCLKKQDVKKFKNHILNSLKFYFIIEM